MDILFKKNLLVELLLQECAECTYYMILPWPGNPQLICKVTMFRKPINDLSNSIIFVIELDDSMQIRLKE